MTQRRGKITGILGNGGDENYKSDWTQMKTLDILVAGDNSSYWLASNEIKRVYSADGTPGIDFSVRMINAYGLRFGILWGFYSGGTVNASSSQYPVRPIIKLQCF